MTVPIMRHVGFARTQCSGVVPPIVPCGAICIVAPDKVAMYADLRDGAREACGGARNGYKRSQDEPTTAVYSSSSSSSSSYTFTPAKNSENDSAMSSRLPAVSTCPSHSSGSGSSSWSQKYTFPR